MKRFFALGLVLLMTAALLAGCAKAPGTYHVSTIDGKQPPDYYREKYSDAEGGSDGLDDYMTLRGLKEEDLKDPIRLTVKEDGTFVMEEIFSGITTEGTWEKKGGTLTLKTETRTMTAKIKGRSLVFAEGDLLGETEVVFLRDK